MISNLISKEKKRLSRKLHSINDSWDSMIEIIQWIQSNGKLPQPLETLGSQCIIRGETDGTMGMEKVKQLLNWNSNATLILSGGVYGREKTIGDIGAIDLYKHIEYDLSLYGYSIEDIKSRVIIDSHSRHTIDQAKILAGIIKAVQSKDIILVLPLYHMLRFLLILSKEMQLIGIKPRIFPKPYGEWYTKHPRKGPIDNIDVNYSYDELFALPPTISRFKGKDECGEVDKIIETYREDLSLNSKQFLEWYPLNII
jgi:hypothetical protein